MQVLFSFTFSFVIVLHDLLKCSVIGNPITVNSSNTSFKVYHSCHMSVSQELFNWV
jgi:hypothetical protein